MKNERCTAMDCPVCHSRRFRKLFVEHNRRDGIACSGTYVRCLGCSVVYLNERPPWEKIVKYYSSKDPLHVTNPGMKDEEEIIPPGTAKPPRWRQILRKIRFSPHSWPLEHVAAGTRRLLDLGCGNGRKLIEFSDRGYEIWGVDVSGDAVGLCKRVVPLGHFMSSELDNIKLPDEYFDYIRIDNVLEHVPDPNKVIEECYRMLKSKGKLFIYVPHGRSFTFLVMRGNSISSWIPFHIQLFTRKSLRYLLTEAGFSGVQMYGYTPATWLPLSIKQWKLRKQKSMKLKVPKWLSMACYPFGVVMKIVGLAEELVGVAVKNISEESV